MPPTSSGPGSARSAAAVNEEIRALLERTRRQLTDAERVEYHALCVEWAAAVKAEIVKAA